MNRKKIVNVLSRSFNKWVKTIDDKELAKKVKRDAFITGGAFISLFQNEKPNDLDIYFRNLETAVDVAQYYVNRWNKRHAKKATVQVIEEEKRVTIYIKSSGIAEEDKEKKPKDEGEYRPVFLSANAITLADGVQLIMRFIGTPEEVHKNFDFVHCTNYFLPYEKKLVMPAEALESYIFKELKYVGSRYPIASILRTRKFINRGWKINAGQYLKMVFQLSQFDLTNPDVLADQLNGVDLLFMTQITDAIQSEKINNPGMSIDHTYLVEVVEKIFDNDLNYDPRLDTEDLESTALESSDEGEEPWI